MLFRIAVVLAGEIVAAIGALVRPYLGLLFLLFLVFARPEDDRPNVAELHVPMVITLAVLAGTVARLGSIGPDLRRAVKQLKLVLLYFFSNFGFGGRGRFNTRIS